jgi:ABC-type arginine transport system permease subunit
VNVLEALLRSGYVGELVGAMSVNLAIAGLALLLGLALGLPLGLLQLGAPWRRRLVSPLIGLMRAAPTFVVMFFLLNIIPPQASVLGIAYSLSGSLIVALSLVPYAAAYAADNGREAWRHLRAGSTDTALLFLPNMVRAFFVLVMSSSAGAAIGVNEGVAVVMREAERWPSLGEKMVVFAIGVAAFAVVFQLGLASMRVLQHVLARR